MIRLLTRADDAACSINANKAIRATYVDGILKNTSVLATGPAVADAAERFRDLDGLCIGLHACLNSEWASPRWGPVLPREKVPTHVDAEGYFYQNPEMLREKGFDIAQALAEIQAQINKLRDAGFELSYMDEHMMFDRCGTLGPGLCEMAKSQGLVFRPEYKRFKPTGPADKKGQAEEIDHATWLLQKLKNASPGAYLCVGHPTYEDAGFIKSPEAGPGAAGSKRTVGEERNQQRLMFMRPDVVAYCKTNDIQLIRYDEIDTSE